MIVGGDGVVRRKIVAASINKWLDYMGPFASIPRFRSEATEH